MKHMKKGTISLVARKRQKNLPKSFTESHYKVLILMPLIGLTPNMPAKYIFNLVSLSCTL